jgi:hypothetical protein
MVELMTLKVGDRVTINRSATTHELGWNSWVKEMDAFVGNNYEVYSIRDNGLFLKDADWYCFPIFVLTKTESRVPDVTLNLSKDYDVLIDSNGTVKVSDEIIPFDKLEEIYNTALKQRA